MTVLVLDYAMQRARDYTLAEIDEYVRRNSLFLWGPSPPFPPPRHYTEFMPTAMHYGDLYGPFPVPRNDDPREMVDGDLYA